MFLLLSIALFSYCWSRYAIREKCFPLVLSFSFGLSLALLLELANFSLDQWWMGFPLLAIAALSCRPRDPEALEWPGWSKSAKLALGLGFLVVFAYTATSMNVFPDDDFWIHFPLQAMLARNGLPVLHPFFAEIQMNGHYGRDLLIASGSKLTGGSLLDTLFWQTVLIQASSFAVVSTLVWRSTRSELCAVLATYSVFFGINVGGRGGLLDTYQNNNALAYFFVLLMFHLLFLVYERPEPKRVLTAGLVLASFAIVYETHFGLIGLVLGVAFLATRYRSFLFVGVLALSMAAVQGGPISSVVHDRLHPSHRQWTPGEMNEHQIIKLTFPKKKFLQIQLASGLYQRRSLVYNLLPDLGALSRVSQTPVYAPVWSWKVLEIHWLVSLLSPISLLVLLKNKDSGSGVGLCFWTFGAFAFLIPGLVNFGPIYEFEYFRWEFAAGFGFAGAFGVALGKLLEDRSTSTKFAVLTVFAATNILPSLYIFLPRTFDLAASPRDLVWPRNEARWLEANKEKLGGFSYEDMLAVREFKQLSQPKQHLLINSPCDKPGDILFSSAFAGLSGLRLVGHSLPWPQEAVGTPPFHHSAPAVAFWLQPSVELLRLMEVDWVYLRPGRESIPAFRGWLSEHGKKIWEHGDCAIFKIDRTLPAYPTKVSRAQSSESCEIADWPASVKTAEVISFVLKANSKTTFAWAFVKEGEAPEAFDRHELVVGKPGSCLTVAPPMQGRYRLCLFSVDNAELKVIPQQLILTVTERHEKP